MYSIGEFSRAAGLTVKALRFYHEKGLLVPAHVDPQSGYRYYDDANLERAKIIWLLRDLEFPLEHVEEILKNCEDDADALVFLEQRRETIQAEIRHRRKLLAALDSFIRRERESQTAAASSPQPVEKELEPMLVAGIRMTGRYEECGRAFGQLGRKVGRFSTGKPLCLYYDGEYVEEGADFEPCFPLGRRVERSGIDVRELPAVRCVTLHHLGPYSELRQSYAKILRHVRELGATVKLPSREVYHRGPGMLFRGDPCKYVTEIQMPLAGD